jgi:hypothetical protein
MLRTASSIPDAALGTFDPKWGYGVVACAALEQILSGGA